MPLLYINSRRAILQNLLPVDISILFERSIKTILCFPSMRFVGETALGGAERRLRVLLTNIYSCSFPCPCAQEPRYCQGRRFSEKDNVAPGAQLRFYMERLAI